MATLQLDPFLQAPTDFLAAMTAGPDAVVDFYRRWSSLIQTFRTAHAQSLVTPETMDAISEVIYKIDLLASSFTEVEENAEDILCELLQKTAVEAPPEPSVFLCDWVLLHLHCLYPSQEEVSGIARAVSATPQWVHTWISDARRAIGWDALVQSNFAGNEDVAMRTARHIYCGLPPTPDMRSDVVVGLLQVKREAEKLRDNAVSALLKARDCEEPLLFASEEEEDTSPPPPVAGVKRCRSDEDYDKIEPKRVRYAHHYRIRSLPEFTPASSTLRSCSLPTPVVHKISPGRRTVSTPLVPTTCTFTLPTGQTLDVDALISPSPATQTPSRKRRATDDGTVVTPVAKRMRESDTAKSASLHVTQQSLDDIRAAPTGVMLPFDIDSWASNIVCAPDLSLDWMSNAFDALTPPTSEVHLTAADFSDPNTFFGFDLTDYAASAALSTDDVYAPPPVAISTSSSPRSVVESLSSASDTSLESLSPGAGDNVALNGDLDDISFEWGSLASLEPIVATKTLEVPGQEKLDMHDSLFNFNAFDTPSQDPLMGLSFGEDPFGFTYGDWSSPQLVL